MTPTVKNIVIKTAVATVAGVLAILIVRKLTGPAK